ncbi:MAG: SH3 domain-containing protein [Chloroflexi bacterium]|nr:SH3 domain-containing protein [Chloroflexota bacterium]
MIAAAMALVILVTSVGFFIVVILSADEPTATVATGTAPTATPTEVVEGVSLTGPVALRSGPADDFAIVTRLAATDEIRILGRSQDGNWLVIGARNRPDVTGWVHAESVRGIDVASLPVMAAPGSTLPVADGTLTPDLPDLIVGRVFSQQNQLWVEVLNQGAADATGGFVVTVNGGEPLSVQVRPGEPLRAGQSVAAPVPGHYLQLRSNISVAVVASEGAAEEETENNTWTGIVGPDVPNDVEVLGAATGVAGEPLVVTVRNNSPIPVAGLFSLSVREALPGTQLLGRKQVTTEVPSDGTFEVVFDDLTEVDMTRVSIILSTDSIDDASLANNAYPR